VESTNRTSLVTNMVKLRWFLTTLFIAAAATQSAAAAPSVAPSATPKVSAPAPAASGAAQKVDTKPGTVAPPKTAAKTPAAAKLPNWVGPYAGKPSKSACYRKTYRTTKRQCGAGYNFDGALTCWTQCPIEYPVACGMECLPQNKDCTKAMLKKVTSVVNVALNAATGGLFGSLTKAGKLVQTGVKCGQQLFSITNKITEMVDEVEKGATEDTILFAVNKADIVVYDLPAAVATCIGVPADKASAIKPVVQKVVNMVVSKKRSGVNLKDFKTFLSAAKSVVPTATASIDALPASDASSLQNIVKSGSSCGMDLNSINNKVIAKVQSLKTENPGATTDVIKFAVLNSDVVLKDLPQAASRCAAATKNPSSREAAATDFQSRDGVIKTVHAMIDQVVEASSKDGKPVSNADFGASVANMGLDAIAMVDPTGIAAMASEFMQSVCGPTAYIGDVDSGAADQALGLNTIEKAFRGSTGTWTAKGDGQLKITFKSSDDKDVKVNVHSGGKKKYQVKVKKGSTVEWSKPLAEFQGKTLYMDRWRTGVLNIAGTGGGSMLVWVPNNKDGALTLTVQINPTSLKNHGRLRS
jgi:hypothetical protein